MTNIEQVKEEYHKEATRLLSNFPEILEAFEQAWQSDEFRTAHLIVHDATGQFDLKYSPEQEKAFYNFYCLFVG
jgi:hypothetical protein